MIHLTDSQRDELIAISQAPIKLESKLTQMRHYLANKEGMADSHITTVLVEFYANMAQPTKATEPTDYEVLGKLYHELADVKHSLVSEFKDDVDNMEQLISNAQDELRKGKAMAELFTMISKFSK